MATIRTADGESVNLPFGRLIIPCAVLALVTWFGGAGWLVWRHRSTWSDALTRWGLNGWLWWCLVDVWEWLWIATGSAGWNGAVGMLTVTPQFWLAFCLAAWGTTFLTLNSSAVTTARSDVSKQNLRWLWWACCVYFVIFTTLNWRLYFNLLVPHGDSVMYEEHLWNLLHGKGFRSYLDQGLFFGEHIQFVHLFLLPLYALWPSHLLLEALSSAALASGAFPVYWMTRRQTDSDRLALAAAIAYLLYFPMQFLDIEIDLKTFRPESFGIPLLLLTLDQIDRRRFIGAIIGIAFCLSVKEDYALIFGPLGIWIAFSRSWADKQHVAQETSGLDRIDTPDRANVQVKPVSGQRRWCSRLMTRQRLAGLLLSFFSVGYLWLATRVIMPWFRSGVEVHYASYFARFGKTPEEILQTWLMRPGLVFDALLTTETGLYAIALLAPLAWLPLLAPGRLAVGLPLFCILCLNELEGSRSPQHQFHAPLVAIIFWSLAASLSPATGMGRAVALRCGWSDGDATARICTMAQHLVWTSALTTGIFFSLSPLGLPFWDSGSSWYWQRLYGSSHRAAMFARIAEMIPPTAHVASTDFVHPRYTHFARSYDYSDYRRTVSGDGKRIPDDTGYVVIDTRHPYSKIKRPDDIPEYRDDPDRWKLLPDTTEGYFIVLKRK